MVWKQWSCMWRLAKIWSMQRKVPDTSAEWEPKTVDITAACRHIVGCVTGHAFSQLKDVLEWSSGRLGTYPRKQQRNLFPPSYCCCGTQSTIGCRWRWLARATYHHKNDLGHRWRQTHINQDLNINTAVIALKHTSLLHRKTIDCEGTREKKKKFSKTTRDTVRIYILAFYVAFNSYSTSGPIQAWPAKTITSYLAS